MYANTVDGLAGAPEGRSRPSMADAGSSQPIYATPVEGIEMMSAFARIRDPALRKALIKIASDLANAVGH